MQPSYYITSTGVKHLISAPTPSSNDTCRQLLLYFLSRNNNGPVLFSDILKHFDNDKSLTFKKISQMTSHQLIDMSESEKIHIENHHTQRNNTLTSYCINNDFVLADLNGLPISCCGFNQHQITNICAIAYDYINASKRSRYDVESHAIETPFSIKTTWNNLDIVIYVIYVNNFSCLLITRNDEFINKNEFINLASHLCNRYNYG